MLVVARAARALPLLAALSRPQSFLRSGFAPFACAAAATSSSSVSDLLAAWLDKALTAEARKRKALQKEADAARSAADASSISFVAPCRASPCPPH
jgi:hypothetical protein